MRSTVEQLAQIATVHILEHDEVLALGRNAEVVNLHDVLVRQRSVDARLGEQHVNEAFIGGQMRQNALDGHRLFEAFFAIGSAQVQLGHVAHGEAVEKLVVSESIAVSSGRAS